mmetsp:Transcript_13777/g.33336  ORF Transcript_13777/g.33336 Transcript_13777/m.33336 type:complete len:314 (-) Transcript_13777:331-1272(-)
MGFPDTPRMDTAAPPRESPSSLVRTAPVMPTAESKEAVRDAAAWPVIASTTRRVSSGWTVFFTLLNSSINSSSTTCLPAVSTTTVSYPSALALSTASFAISAGSASVPIENTVTSIDFPNISNCSMAAGRYTSAAASNTFRLRFGRRLASVFDRSSSDIPDTASESTSRSLRYSASFPAAVVLPAPCNPARRITVGSGLSAPLHASVAVIDDSEGFDPIIPPPDSAAASPPIMSRSSSYIALTNCCSAVTPFVTSCPRERRFTPSMSAVATSRLTSASRRARRTDFRAGWIEFSVIRCLPPKFCATSVRADDN